MYNSVVQQIEGHVVPQDISAHGHHSDVSGQSGCVARMARSTGYEPNLSKIKVATNRSAAQMISRDIENNFETNSSYQQRGLLSELTSESAQALKVHRLSPVQEAKAEMMWRDTRNLEVVSQRRSELQHYRRHV